MFEMPFFTRVKNAQRILIAGAGGGFDIFSGLPLYFSLKNTGQEVFLANLSFAQLEYTSADKISSVCWEVTADSEGGTYFPEQCLCSWFAQRDQNVSIYAFDSGTGVVQLKEAYQALVKLHNIDTIILVLTLDTLC